MIADSPGRHPTAPFIQGEVSEDYGLPGFILHVNSVHWPRIPGGTCCCRIGLASLGLPGNLASRSLKEAFKERIKRKLASEKTKALFAAVPH